MGSRQHLFQATEDESPFFANDWRAHHCHQDRGGRFVFFFSTGDVAAQQIN